MNRRDFLQVSAVAGLFPRVALSESRLDLAAATEALVRVIEDTPRDRLLEEIASRVRKGLSYREVLAALFVANVRNVRPTPVGFKFHSVLAINAAYQTSLAGPDADRWLPIFWSLDNFKGSQADEKQKTGWTLPRVDEKKVPPADRAKQAFVEALDHWDVEAIDGPTVALARNFSQNEVFELYFRHGMRDFRDIGHKAIFVAGAYRLLNVIGWEHAEPILRSLSLALQYYTGENPRRSNQDADKPWKHNLTAVGSVPAGWRQGRIDDGATKDLLVVARSAGPEAMTEKVLDVLKSGASPRSVWDALFPAGGEILMRRPGILSLHALTTFNALRFVYETSASDETCRLALLQAASFLPLFRGKLDKDVKLDQLEPATATLDDVFADISKDKMSASRKVLGYLKDGGDAKAIVDGARRLVFTKGLDAHDYKFSAAILEDAALLSPAWRDRFLAASVHHLKGPQSPDNGLVQRIRAALAQS